MDIREDREPHIATERARSISGSQHEMRISPGHGGVLGGPASGKPCLRLTCRRTEDLGRWSPGLTPRGVVINFGRWAPLPVNPRYGAVVHSFKSRGPSRRVVRPTKGRTVGSEWTKTEAADEAEAAATTVARVKCLMRCARTVAKPRRFRLNRTRRGLSTAEIVSQSAGRDGSKIENGTRSNLFPFELLTRRAAGAELVFNSQSF